MRLTVYGASDDLVEFEGNVTNTDPGDAIASNGAEFPVYCPDGKGYFVLAGKNGDSTTPASDLHRQRDVGFLPRR